MSLEEPLPLIIASTASNERHLLIGTGSVESISLTTRRIESLLQSGVHPVLVNPSSSKHSQILLNTFPRLEVHDRSVKLADLTTLGRILTSRVVDRVYVNLPFSQCNEVPEIFKLCSKLRIPINTYQQPEYSTFHMLPTYVDPQGSGLQISVTTNGCGYVLANRIKRDIISKLPNNISQVVGNMAQLRNELLIEHNEQLLKEPLYQRSPLGSGLDDDDQWESHTLNTLVEEFAQNKQTQQKKRTRWLSQVMEYYPLEQLASLTWNQLDASTISSTTEPAFPSISELSTQRKGHLSLVGSGPGSVGMLTIGALNEIKSADIILADKLVPQPILELIPKGTETFIARKFPGNAERAQQELLELGLSALQDGKKVVRLKQGDPYIFGRGGEEYLYFASKGFTPTVLPGLSSALTSTIVAAIPATHRDVADQVLICTGTGRRGDLPEISQFVESRTTVFLMALHRAALLTKQLLENNWPSTVPVAIVERASCSDQRVTRTQLQYLPQVIEEIGSRPPGLLIMGNAVMKLVPSNTPEFTADRMYHIDEGYTDTSISLETLSGLSTGVTV
ncbi:similar to Saccharomyces cerevisiae YKR069W MET1 S-adenosyl-L-methionine uroporphyrinogen III transmethylase, involved in the biosynthesis of siroheme, a prosthetic group used by sulfite reductase [Maudiozyma barnettii]|uniref:uroporphyrinogen-III C-methyltransferase n=1 Tax=Maudiozyma barnettii TaxID=61262 RepID=A0A8H2VI10_9SACH|nr:uroporphyrinogen-III C-methyltransferase [Kazachstania barnettii]CAB4256024.1 similar to Saccharomyces cerevisiae YKR069W MET1 S-adenosyl-L-methionine uroporphyrinogen III transmethylase, involved in the biosynthesis of siroheme, a prosthetic group used by sulfite reductase [Kazachstania barnettii]CAD1784632.1 similar to Saccharomyces cerevisiae YKR069W MET1 S-adenosyl-L-methionine uroporphyrinogen III transmethylase, involved in the biosynthesis of siroheme, a prosthetic group used by sulfite